MKLVSQVQLVNHCVNDGTDSENCPELQMLGPASPEQGEAGRLFCPIGLQAQCLWLKLWASYFHTDKHSCLVTSAVARLCFPCQQKREPQRRETAVN